MLCVLPYAICVYALIIIAALSSFLVTEVSKPDTMSALGLGSRFLVLVLLLAFSSNSNGQPAQDSVINEAGKSKDTLSKLYATIRNVAQPPVTSTATGSEVISSRLVLLLPGKVLNYYDYFPGDRYEASLEDPHHDGRQVPIPPRVMENMFQLADVVPGVYPLGGAETGESMSIIYENILNQLEVKGFNRKTQAEKERYVDAISYLAEEIADPLDVTLNVTRFQLYRRSQDLYNEKRLDMENIISNKRFELSAIEYELWFQRNYPSLNSQVEGAYTEWLIFGQKEIVELYKSYLDVQSPGIDLEAARMALRASGLSALDRTRTVYPVTFVPSNWYRYLTNVSAV